MQVHPIQKHYICLQRIQFVYQIVYGRQLNLEGKSRLLFLDLVPDLSNNEYIHFAFYISFHSLQTLFQIQVFFIIVLIKT